MNTTKFDVSNEARLAQAVAVAPHMELVPLYGVVEDPLGMLQCECGSPRCTRKGKHPRSKRPTSRNPNEIAAWMRDWPLMNFGGLLPPELAVVDLDVHPGRPNGFVAFECFSDHFALPIGGTVTAHTGAGTHLYYRVPPRTELPTRIAVLPGVDVLGAGSYVVLPGSRHGSGVYYTWSEEASPSEELFATMPREMVELWQERESFTLAPVCVEGLTIRSLRPPVWKRRQLLNSFKPNHLKIRATWDYDRGPGTRFAFPVDTSTSAYEMALAAYAAYEKWLPGEIVGFLEMWRERHGLKAVAKSRLSRTALKAIAMLAKVAECVDILGGRNRRRHFVFWTCGSQV